ncbi:MAG: hypothetical protein A3F43_05340 [Gammaproteobacteria bacterium RIFCSPHIGHO2_12_FULL_42_10]|nr:MAG: hypothetical protein A3F43_05340 [Gammaproteobacteria bacterium RIFCSPHIGHO2_12_FULL_42_10]
MIHMTFEEAAHLLKATINKAHPGQTFHGLSIDTRTLVPKNAFIALKGTTTDGHDFLEIAKNQGAAVAIVTHPLASTLPQLIVPDVVDAMAKLSFAWRKTFHLPAIAVTGSNGKTTTKNIIANIFIAACKGDAAQVLATAKSFNNHLGLPLTLSQLNKMHRFAVIEMGMNHFGEIKALTQLAEPSVAIITNAAAAHLEGLGDIAGVARAKAEIFVGLQENGVAILNRDDTFFHEWQKAASPHRIISFGFHPEASVRATCHTETPEQYFTLHTPKGDIAVHSPLLGKHNVQNALAATAAALAVGIDLNSIAAGIQNTLSAPGRLHRHHLQNGAVIIDDTYNANPYSLQAAIETLATFKNKRILILGDMHGLGQEAEAWHKTIGEKIRAQGIDALFTYGNWSYQATRQFGKDALHFEKQSDLINAVKPLVQDKTTLLVKGSRVMQMEKIIAALLDQTGVIDGH